MTVRAKIITLALSLCLFWAGATLPAALAAERVPVVSAAEFETLVSSHQGKPLVLVYWASWCVPCREYKKKTHGPARGLSGKRAANARSFR